MKYFLIFTLSSLILSINLFSQEEDSIAWKRERYFFIQRGSPYDSVPQNALLNALTEKSGT